MATSSQLTTAAPRADVPMLENGDALDQSTFHRRYEAMPTKFRAELIDGVVYVQAPLALPHGRSHGIVMQWLGEYETCTPGVAVYDNVTTFLGAKSEVQPDAVMVIDPALGGKSRITEDGEYLAGAPEFVVEVASSSESYDLHAKRLAYQEAGVQEYVVVLLREESVRWFALDDKRYVPVPADGSYFKSRVFPGLWLDHAALVALERGKVMDVLRQGVSSPEHTALVEDLGRRRNEPS